MRTRFLTIGLLLGVSAIARASQTIPPEAVALVEHIHTAASARNFPYLKSVMTNDFTWSFGADENTSGAAIEAWRHNPSLLKHLEQVTGQPCARRPKGYIECPKNAGVDYRAGFKQSPSGWRMVYFVAGD